jgi:hypothetical protein
MISLVALVAALLTGNFLSGNTAAALPASAPHTVSGNTAAALPA